MEIFTLLETLEDILERSKTVPFTNKGIVEKEELIDIIKEIRRFIEKCAGRINIKYEETRNLAYNIEEHTNAWFVAIQIKMKTIGANKRIKKIEEKLNTYEEIIDFKIVQCCKNINNTPPSC